MFLLMQFQWQKCEIISQAGARLDSTGCKGNTALHYAAQNAEADVMEELIGRGLAVGLTNFRWIISVVHTVCLPCLLQGGISGAPCLWCTRLSWRHQTRGAFAEARIQSEEGANQQRMHSSSLCCSKRDKGGENTFVLQVMSF